MNPNPSLERQIERRRTEIGKGLWGIKNPRVKTFCAETRKIELITLFECADDNEATEAKKIGKKILMMTMKFSLAMAAILSRCNTLMLPTSPYLFVSYRFPLPHRRPSSPRGLFQSPEAMFFFYFFIFFFLKHKKKKKRGLLLWIYWVRFVVDLLGFCLCNLGESFQVP
ncbi:unnamed protein product [Camellia sinensis]